MKVKTQKLSGIPVVLLDDIQRLGQRGEVKNLKPGFFQHLLRLGKVMQVNQANKGKIEQLKLINTQRAAAQQQTAQTQKSKIEELVFIKKLKVGEHEEVFGSVSLNDLKQFLADQGIEVARDQIELEHPIHELVETTVKINLGYGVVAELKILVEGEV